MTISRDDAVSTAKRFARQTQSWFEAVNALIEHVDNVNKLDQLTQEAEQARNAKLAEADEARRILDRINSEIAGADGKVKAAIEASKQHEASAKSNAEAIVSAAREDAAAIVVKGKTEAQKIIDEAQNKSSDIRISIADLTATAAKLDAQIKEKSASLTAIEAKIAAARDMMKSFMSSANVT